MWSQGYLCALIFISLKELPNEKKGFLYFLHLLQLLLYALAAIWQKKLTKKLKIPNSGLNVFLSGSTGCRSSNSIVGHAVVYILRLIGHTHDRESPIQNFSTAPKKLGAHISSPVWPPKPTEFVSYLGNLRCDAFTALKSVQSARNESFLAGSDNFHRVLTAIEFEAWLVD